MRVPAFLVWMLASLPLVPRFAFAGPLDESAALIYSDVCVHPESSDLLGDRVVLMRFPDGDYVYFQTAEGVFGPPQIVKAVVASNGTDIEFKVSDLDKAAANFKGRLTEEALIGSFDNGWQNRVGSPVFRFLRVAERQPRFPRCE